ncbi:hypothetical protein NG798_00300 [Ancylothrix sp. C2]|uniref:hypothetical protein n=1 Tax=Ancylothrix sp. D3o TaxID=2953691 RepID=UPI0021BAA5B5|nr:hypothetical protein [Ancylothrix sp. D3o]MCT7948232.1 hypothetical protein [Ancylothrix sp. D3o]
MNLNDADNKPPFNNKANPETLGIKNPLLTPQTLGQTPLGSEFYLPQTAQSLAVFFSVPEHDSSPDDEEIQSDPESLKSQPKIEETTDNKLEKNELPLLPKVVENLAHIPPKPALQTSTPARLPLTLDIFAEPASNFPDIVLETPPSNTSIVREDSEAFFNLNSQGIFYNNPEENLGVNLDEPTPTQEFMIASEGEEIIFTPSGFQRQEKKQIPPPTAEQKPTPPVTIQAKKTSPNQENENLEVIAEKVYKIIKQRLQIEGERSGRYRSGRLP